MPLVDSEATFYGFCEPPSSHVSLEFLKSIDTEIVLATDYDQLLAERDALLATTAKLRDDAERYRRIRYCRKFVGMLETATMHCETDAEYDEAVDALPTPSVTP
jgi:hypothetical protein